MVNPKQVLDAVWAQALTDEGITWDRNGTNRAMTSDASRVLAEVQSAVFDSVASEVNRRSLNPGAETDAAVGRRPGRQRVGAAHGARGIHHGHARGGAPGGRQRALL